MYRREIIEYFGSFEFFHRVYHAELFHGVTVSLDVNSTTLSTDLCGVHDNFNGGYIDSSTRFFGQTRHICTAELFGPTFDSISELDPVHNSTGVELN